MSDLIDRQEAIDLIKRHIGRPVVIGTSTFRDGLIDGYARAISELQCLPSAEPERKTGRWILKSHLWECDKCGCRIHRANPLKGNIWNYNYCPNCGCKMEVEHE